MSIFKRLEILIWGVLSYAFEVLPKILDALHVLGFDKYTQKIVDALHAGGLAIDDFVEQHATQLLDLASFFERIGGWFMKKASLLRELHYEGTQPRAPGEEDAFTVERVAYFTKAFLDQDGELAEILNAGKSIQEPLAVAAAVGVRQDVSKSPTLDC